MFAIDLRTVFLNYIFTDLVCLIVIIILWFQTRKRFDGVGYLVIDYLFQVFAVVLIMLRGHIPDIFSIIVANFLLIVGTYMGYLGLEKFIGRKSKQYLNYLVIIVFISTHYFYTYYSPNVEYRNVNSAFAYLFFSISVAWVLLVKTPKHLRKITKNLGYLFIVYSIFNAVRVAENFLQTNFANDYLKSQGFEVFAVMTYQTMFMFLTFFVAIMINKRLLFDIESQEQKFSVAFQAVPYAILITRNFDGKVIEVNKGFEKISKYTMQEVIAKSTLELNLWVNANERDALLFNLQKDGFVDDMEFEFRRKNAEILIGSISCIAIVVNEEDCVLSVINDVTEKKKSEIEIKKSREILKSLVLNLQIEHDEQKINLATQIDNLLNQTLTALRFNIGVLKQSLNKDSNGVSKNLIELVDKTYLNIDSSIENSKQLMGNLRNEVLYLLGFVDALDIYLEEFIEKTGIKCQFECICNEIQIDKTQSTALFRIFQDIMNHIVKVNTANSILLKLSVDANVLQFSMIEDGDSFNAIMKDLEKSDFVSILKERASIINARFNIATTENANTRIAIEMPLNVLEYQA